MEVFLLLAVFAPVTVITVIFVTVYIRKSTQKLYDEMRRRGLLVDAVPVVIPYNVLVENEIRSPITGLPPPPPYTPGPGIQIHKP